MQSLQHQLSFFQTNSHPASAARINQRSDETQKEEQLAWYDYAIRYCDKPEYLTHTEHLMVVLMKQ